MASEDFYNDWIINNNKKQNKCSEESRFILTEYSKEGCNYCLQSRCNVHNGQLAKNIHPKIRNIVKNPSNVLGDFKDILIDNGFDVNNKHIHVNTCVWNYTHSKCQNCIEGRFKEFKWKNHNGELIDLKFCVPVLKDNNVIPIGLHWDVDITIKDNEVIQDKLIVKKYDGFKNYYNPISEEINHDIVKNEEPSFEEPINDLQNLQIKDNNNVWNNINKTNIKKQVDSGNNEFSEIEKDNIDNKISKNDYDKRIDNLNKEISLLTKENYEQKQHIKCLKSAISCDKPIPCENNIEKNKDYELTIEILKEKIEKIESENNKLKNKISKDEKKQLTEVDKKNIQNATKHFSNILFQAILTNHYDK